MQKNTGLLVFALLLFVHPCFSQTTDSTNTTSHFSGSVLVTNNGISLVPTFSLGKPATIFYLSVGKGKFSFEPDMRFALEGKPWSFLFWWRYKLARSDKFMMNVGAHPALNFKTVTSATDGKETIVTRRFLAAELSPAYFLTKSISVGAYYLYSYGFDQGTAKNTHFITVNTNFSNIKLPSRFYMKVLPQFYYLKQDQQDGFFFTSSFTLARNNFPLSISSIINKTTRSNIAGSKDFVWNLSLAYSFNNRYVKL